MNITRTKDPETGDLRITIDIPAGEDPHGWITGLLQRRRLETLLTVIARPDAYDWIADPDGMHDALTALGWVDHHLANRLGGVLLAARDQHAMSWGAIASAVDRPRQTVKSRIVQLRRSFAEQGAAYTSEGLREIGTVAARKLAEQRENAERQP